MRASDIVDPGAMIAPSRGERGGGFAEEWSNPPDQPTGAITMNPLRFWVRSIGGHGKSADRLAHAATEHQPAGSASENHPGQALCHVSFQTFSGTCPNGQQESMARQTFGKCSSATATAAAVHRFLAVKGPYHEVGFDYQLEGALLLPSRYRLLFDNLHPSRNWPGQLLSEFGSRPS